MWFYRAALLQPETSSSLLGKMEFKIIDFVVAAFKVVGSSSRSIKGLGQFFYAYTTGAISLMAPAANAGHGYQHRPSYGRTTDTETRPLATGYNLGPPCLRATMVLD